MGKLCLGFVGKVWVLLRGRKTGWDLSVPVVQVLTGVTSVMVLLMLSVQHLLFPPTTGNRVKYSRCVCVCVALHACALKLRTAFANAAMMPFYAALLPCSFNCSPTGVT